MFCHVTSLSLPSLFLSVLQHIITQDFAKSQDPPSSSSSLPSSSSSSSFSSTFQSSGVGGVGRVKPPASNAHHQRTPSRVSPENSDKPRARYLWAQSHGVEVHLQTFAQSWWAETSLKKHYNGLALPWTFEWWCMWIFVYGHTQQTVSIENTTTIKVDLKIRCP